MRHLWHDVITHRLATALLLITWVALWVPVVSGFEELFLLHLPLIMLASGVLVLWNAAPFSVSLIDDDSIHGGIIAALFIGIADALIGSAAFVAAFVNGSHAPGSGWRHLIGNVFIAMMMPIVAFIVGVVGSLSGLLLAVFIRFLHDLYMRYQAREGKPGQVEYTTTAGQDH